MKDNGRASVRLPAASSPAPAAGHAVTHVRFEEDNEDRFVVAGSDDYAAVVDQGHRVWILEIWVHPDRRGHGRAAALLEAVIAHYPGRVLALSAEPFSWADGEREPARLDAGELAAWYARHGFRRTGGHRMRRLPSAAATPRQPASATPQPACAPPRRRRPSRPGAPAR